MGFWHIGAQDMSQVIWQSSDRGIAGSGDKEGKREKREKIIIQSQERNTLLESPNSLDLVSSYNNRTISSLERSPSSLTL